MRSIKERHLLVKRRNWHGQVHVGDKHDIREERGPSHALKTAYTECINNVLL